MIKYFSINNKSSEQLENEFSSSSNNQKSSSESSPRQENTYENDVKFIPSYYGESNAFSIQLFCIDEQFDSRSIDFLPKAFEQFPDKDFCIITLPPNVPEFSLIQNFLVIFLLSAKLSFLFF